jgi:hypothetical protein
MRMLLLASLLAVACSAQQVSNSDLEASVASVLPTAAENRWTEIPWRTDLAAALKEGETKHKPIYMWVMDGHPLGCT